MVIRILVYVALLVWGFSFYPTTATRQPSPADVVCADFDHDCLTETETADGEETFEALVPERISLFSSVYVPVFSLPKLRLADTDIPRPTIPPERS
jgi:hypothetical protein